MIIVIGDKVIILLKTIQTIQYFIFIFNIFPAIPFIDAYSANNNIQYCLCNNCHVHLMDDNLHNTNQPDQTWSAFIWMNIIGNCDNHNAYGIKIWKFRPRLWQHWRIQSVTEILPNIFTGVSIDQLAPLIDDRIMNLKEWNGLVESYELQN